MTKLAPIFSIFSITGGSGTQWRCSVSSVTASFLGLHDSRSGSHPPAAEELDAAAADEQVLDAERGGARGGSGEGSTGFCDEGSSTTDEAAGLPSADTLLPPWAGDVFF